MTRMTLLQALNAAMAHEMDQDDDVVILGEDVGTAGGIFRVTQGLQLRFGPERVIDTPLDEKGIAGHAVGMALYGMKPIAEIQFSGFIHDAFEQIMFCGAKYRWLTGGQYTVPMVIRAPSYGGIRGGFWHSQSIETYYAHGGGVKIVSPSTPRDAYGLMLTAIRDPDPVLVAEPVPLYRSLSDDIEDDGEAVPLGVASIVRSGSDLTLITYGPLVHAAKGVADALAATHGYDIELIDLRTLVPYDVDTLVSSAQKQVASSCYRKRHIRSALVRSWWPPFRKRLSTACALPSRGSLPTTCRIPTARVTNTTARATTAFGPPLSAPWSSSPSVRVQAPRHRRRHPRSRDRRMEGRRR